MDSSAKAKMIGDYVSYRRNGVCRVVDITTENFGRQGKKQYYVLNSVYDKNVKVFVPIGSEIENDMKPLPTKEDVRRFISDSDGVELRVIDDAKSRAAYFDSIISGGDRTEILALLKMLRKNKSELENSGKKLKANDLKYLSASENIITGEFGFVLDIPRSEVVEYVYSYSSGK